MSNAIFWGLTNQDFENALWNGLSQTAVCIGGFLAAAIANTVALELLSSNQKSNRSNSNVLAATVLGLGAGIAASVYFSHRLPYVTFAGEKALKFFAISIGINMVSGRLPLPRIVTFITGFITSGGMFGYFGHKTLYAWGTVGAVGGSLGLGFFNSASDL